MDTFAHPMASSTPTAVNKMRGFPQGSQRPRRLIWRSALEMLAGKCAGVSLANSSSRGSISASAPARSLGLYAARPRCRFGQGAGAAFRQKAEELSLSAPRSGRATCDGDNAADQRSPDATPGGLEWRFIWICTLRLGRVTFPVTASHGPLRKRAVASNPTGDLYCPTITRGSSLGDR